MKIHRNNLLQSTIGLNAVLVAALLLCTCVGGTNAKPDVRSDSLKVAKKSVPATVTLAFTGDIMMGTNFPKPYITSDRGKSLFKDCGDILRSADIAIVNLEGACYEGTEGKTTKNVNSKNSYIFRMPGDHAHHLSDVGIDAVNMANNHSNDFGLTGRQNTLKTMEGLGIKAVGQRDLAEYAVIERNGVKFVYIGFAASCRYTLDMQNYAEVDAMIDKCKKIGDILVVTFHGGAEGVANQHVPRKTEIFLGERRGNVYEFAHHCIDRGADIVVGHGPHVPRAMEIYNGHLIAYSLGNFCTPYRMSLNGAAGLAPLLNVTLNTEDGTFKEGEVISFRQQSGVGPRRDNSNTAAVTMRNLTLQDFPNTTLEITPEGKLLLKN